MVSSSKSRLSLFNDTLRLSLFLWRNLLRSSLLKINFLSRVIPTKLSNPSNQLQDVVLNQESFSPLPQQLPSTINLALPRKPVFQQSIDPLPRKLIVQSVSFQSQRQPVEISSLSSDAS